MATAIVLGAGMVGSVMAADLSADRNLSVTIADRSKDALARAAELSKRLNGVDIKVVEANLADPAIVKKTIAPYDIVLGALSSTIGFQTLRAVIEAKKNYCDISFMPENALDLDELAKTNNVTAVVDCGVAPGMSNMLAGYATAQLDDCTDIDIYVGGIPVERRWPFEYKAGFSPYDVIEEYTRPSRLVENGKVVTREALTECEPLDFDGLGTLEAFNTDGLRSLIYTLNVPNMKEKTMRYPRHVEIMRVLRHMGLFSHEPVDINGPSGKVRVRPIDVTSALMFPQWQYQPGEEDMTVMRVSAKGKSGGTAGRTLQWDLQDRFDQKSQCTSMSRTTALPCTIVARMILNGQYSVTGVIPPELIGAKAGMVDHVLKELSKRGVEFTHRAE